MFDLFSNIIIYILDHECILHIKRMTFINRFFIYIGYFAKKMTNSFNIENNMYYEIVLSSVFHKL